MIEKIIASDILVADFDYIYGLLPADTIIYDASRKVDIQPKDSPKIKLLSEICGDYLFMRSYGMRMANQEHGGCLEIQTSEFTYMIQYCNGIGYFESVRKDGKWEILVGNDGDNLLPEKYLPIDRPYPKIPNASEYFVFLHTSFGESIRADLNKTIIRDSNFYSRIPKLLLYTSPNVRSRTIEVYNRYLRRAWNKEIRIDPKFLDRYLLVSQDYKLIDLSNPSSPMIPMSCEGGGFLKYLHYIDALEEAKKTDSLLIVENFGEGLDDDKTDVLFDEIRSLGIYAYLSTSD